VFGVLIAVRWLVVATISWGMIRGWGMVGGGGNGRGDCDQSGNIGEDLHVGA